MQRHLDTNDPKYADLAAAILWWYDNPKAEANITSAVRDFLTGTELVDASQIVEENPPAQGSRRAVDLTALDTFIEFKRRIGTTAGFNPDPENVRQLDDYLAQSAAQGRVRMGVLTDGKRWLLRWPGAGAVSTAKPYAFTLEDKEHWLPLYEWLRDSALVALENITPDRETIAAHLGPGSPAYLRDIATLKTLYQDNAHRETIRVKRSLWYDLLRTALGEIAYTTEGISPIVREILKKSDDDIDDTQEMDDLFVRHTYLSAVIGMVVQASFGIDIRRLADDNPADLLRGKRLFDDTGLRGVLESDFFAWPNEVGGAALLQTLARRVARFNWKDAPPDTAVALYETVIPADERRQLGEYYTPTWLVRAMMRELVSDPLNQRVLDPACGSGAFIAEAVSHFIEAAQAERWDAWEVLGKLRDAVTGIDVHPVAVHLARAAWVLAARPAINAATKTGVDAELSIPVYLGDALQLRFPAGDLLAQKEITIRTTDERNTELTFPVSLIERADQFDELMSDIADCVERGADTSNVLNDHHVHDSNERKAIGAVIAAMQRLHARGRDHIWAYYTRNMVRPVALSHAKVDVVIGNPPWINYNQTADILRTGLEDLSRNRYGIWAGGRYATHQDVAGLFFARSVDLYLNDGGVIGFVLPHSALQAGQYTKWRTGRWRVGKRGPVVNVDFTLKPAWDLERLEPNTFFPIPASVAFARKLAADATPKPLTKSVERWRGKAGAPDVWRETTAITDTSEGGESPYGGYARQGATIVPRSLFFVEETENPAIIQAAPTITVNARRGKQDKPPWNALNLSAISGQTIERSHLFNVHLGETTAPYVALEPLKALLPFNSGDALIHTDGDGPGGVRMGGLGRRMRERWRTISDLWSEHKAPVNPLTLLGQLDYLHKLSSQLAWQQDRRERPFRVMYTTAGQPTAAILEKPHFVAERLYWIPCSDMEEANYLLAIINSDALANAVNRYTTPNWAGNTRDLHKHLWKLPIPQFDPALQLHVTLADAGATAASAAAQELARIRAQWGERFSVTIARRELRKWLRASAEGQAVEGAVGRLLAGA